MRAFCPRSLKNIGPRRPWQIQQSDLATSVVTDRQWRTLPPSDVTWPPVTRWGFPTQYQRKSVQTPAQIGWDRTKPGIKKRGQNDKQKLQQLKYSRRVFNRLFSQPHPSSLCRVFVNEVNTTLLRMCHHLQQNLTTLLSAKIFTVTKTARWLKRHPQPAPLSQRCSQNPRCLLPCWAPRPTTGTQRSFARNQRVKVFFSSLRSTIFSSLQFGLTWLGFWDASFTKTFIY